MIGFLDLTVAENIFINHEIIKNGLVDWKEMNKKTDEILKTLDVNFSSTDKLGNLSLPQQQVVAIAKALSVNADIIIMDEPTASLSKKESLQIYDVVDKLKNEGKSIIYISHRLEDIYRLAERMTVIRDGR